MATSESQYIKLCIKQIEKKFSFSEGNGSLQRNLENLSLQIETKTNICISLSTLKRLWKSDFKQSPQMATLNALANMLDYNDWLEFRQANRKKVKLYARRNTLTGLSIVLLIVIAILSFFNLKSNEKNTPNNPKINGLVEFSTIKTVTEGIPNTVIFNYDVSNVKADSFFIQQSWNDNNKVKIDPAGKAFSSIYYESGYHRARLIANDKTIAMQPVHILSNGWEPHIYYSYKDIVPIDFKNEKFINNGQLHLTKPMLEKQHIDFSKNFFTRISNSREFNISSDSFALISRVKADSLQNSLCPWINLIVVTEKHIFSVNLQKKGCEHYASYKLGEIVRNGEDTDLSALGCNVYNWQEIGIHVENKSAQLSINDKVVFNEVFKEEFGRIVGLIYIFEGTGSIDFVCMKDGNGNAVFEDHFD